MLQLRSVPFFCLLVAGAAALPVRLRARPVVAHAPGWDTAGARVLCELVLGLCGRAGLSGEVDRCPRGSVVAWAGRGCHVALGLSLASQLPTGQSQTGPLFPGLQAGRDQSSPRRGLS